MSVYPRNHKDSKILVFVEDFASYHLELIRSGIQDYFDRAERALSYVQVNLTELTRFFGNSIFKQIVVIGVLRGDDLIHYFEEAGIPCVNLVEKESHLKLNFDLAFEGEGTMAADYFIHDLKVENLGFMGRLGEKGHDRRFQEFKRVAEKKRLSVERCDLKKQELKLKHMAAYLKNDLASHDDTIRSFLTGLKKPAGVFCADDRIAFDCYFNCEALGIAVPNEVAILGVGSRSQAKATWTRSVSVVEVDHHHFGFAAAKLMNEYVVTGKVPAPVRLAPSGIQHNQTTVQRRVTDSLMQKALAMIVEEPEITVKKIAERLNLSRNAFDVRFYNATHTTPSKMIEQERFRRAKELLRNQKYSVESIAGLAGYPNRRSMRRSFQRFTKMSPHKFREWENREVLDDSIE